MIFIKLICIYLAVSQTSSSNNVVDPNSSNAGSNNSSNNNSNGSSSGGLSKASLIGICVSVGVAVYAAATIAVIRVYRKRRTAKEEKAIAEHQVFSQSISDPIMQDNSLGWSNTGGGYNHQRQPYQNNNSHQW